MVKNPKKPFLKKEEKNINVSSGWFNMAWRRHAKWSDRQSFSGNTFLGKLF